MSDIVFGVCINCHSKSSSPMAKFPLRKPVPVKDKPTFFEIEYGLVCPNCAVAISKTFKAKADNGDFRVSQEAREEKDSKGIGR